MRSMTDLPEGYGELYSIDLQKDKKKAILINGLAGVIMLAMCIPVHFAVPFSTLFSFDGGLLRYCLRFVVLIVGLLVYTVLHELVHGAVMRIHGAQKVRFGFTGLYAFAGSENDYFGKSAYIQIALAPLILLGLLILPLCFIVPKDWFWVVYMIEVANVSGAIGDLYVSVKFAGMPKDILVKDTGVSMTVYGKQ